MGQSNLMIRLIDVVFILLFAFIAISQLGANLAIEPPKSSEAMEVAPDGEQTVIIGVTKEGTYPVDSGNLILKNISELQGYLTEKMSEAAAKGGQVGVRIRANWDSSVEFSLAAAKLCRDLGIPKGLDVVKLNGE